MNRISRCFLIVVLAVVLVYGAIAGEIVSQRSRSGKVFDLGNGQRRVECFLQPIHYKIDLDNDEEVWKDIDCSIVPIGSDSWRELASWRNNFRVYFDYRAKCEFEFRGKALRVQPVELAYTNDAGDWQTISLPVAVAAKIEGNRIVWPGMFGPGFDFEYVVESTRLSKYLTIHSLASLPKLTIKEEGVCLTLVMGVAWDSGLSISNVPATIDSPPLMRAGDVSLIDPGIEGRSQIKVRVDGLGKQDAEITWQNGGMDLWSIKRPFALDGQYRRHDASFAVSYNYVNSVLEGVFAQIDFPLVDLNAIKSFPVKLDPTITPAIGASGDDGHVRSSTLAGTSRTAAHPPQVSQFSSIVTNGTSVTLGVSGDYDEEEDEGEDDEHSPFFIFRSVGIPQGATITAANLRLYSYGNSIIGSCTIVSRLMARDIDDAPSSIDLTAYKNTTTYPFTTAYVGWVPSAWTLWQPYDSPEMKTIIQELVDRSGWSSGNDMWIDWVVAGYSSVGDGDEKEYYSMAYDYGSSVHYPRMTITYTADEDDSPMQAVMGWN